MRQSYTAVVERNRTFSGPFFTEPYEGGWACEALLFIRALEVAGDNPQLAARVQISPDGILWCDEGTEFPALKEAGLCFARTKHFGNWLRVAGEVTGEGARFKVLVYVVLKE